MPMISIDVLATVTLYSIGENLEQSFHSEIVLECNILQQCLTISIKVLECI